MLGHGFDHCHQMQPQAKAAPTAPGSLGVAFYQMICGRERDRKK